MFLRGVELLSQMESHGQLTFKSRPSCGLRAVDTREGDLRHLLDGRGCTRIGHGADDQRRVDQGVHIARLSGHLRGLQRETATEADLASRETVVRIAQHLLNRTVATGRSVSRLAHRRILVRLQRGRGPRQRGGQGV